MKGINHAINTIKRREARRNYPKEARQQDLIY
jgi:hypothetical protein